MPGHAGMLVGKQCAEVIFNHCPKDPCLPLLALEMEHRGKV